MIEPKTIPPSDAGSQPPLNSSVLPELLAPAGDWDCARAAVENGADAIYFGLDQFNARMRARNFTEADLPELVRFLHGRGVRGYVTFNTLVFADELASAAQYLRAIIAAGIDAAIVQDVGICRLIRQISPDFPIHASTQMTVTSAAGVEFARELGCELVVLARECSIAEIEKIQKAIRVNDARRFPLEVFVHGALCVAYSGQCLTSEALGGRSANRGECAQACRLPYELISDGRVVPLGDKRYLLSPQDLAGLSVLPELIRSGVTSLKIEGRLKSPEYVANITRLYRDALDEFFAKQFSSNGSAPNEPEADWLRSIDSRSRYRMEMAFSRGLHTGWLGGINNQALVHARFGKKRGVYLGHVLRIERQQIVTHLEAPLKPGDGIVFDHGQPEADEEGGRVYHLANRGQETVLEFGHGDLNWKRIYIGDKIWKTSDPELDTQLRATYRRSTPQHRRPVDMEVYGAAGLPLTLAMRDEAGHIAQVTSGIPLVPARTQPLSAERLREQLGRLGATPFKLRNIQSHLEGAVLLPIHELNALRQRAAAQLELQCSQPKRWTLSSDGPQLRINAPTASRPLEPELIVLVRSLPQLERAIDLGLATVYCEFEDPKKYREAVRLFRERDRGQAQPPPPRASHAIFVAPPRIFKMGEDWILRQLLASEADGYLIRNYDHLAAFQGFRAIGDFSLNISNGLTAEYFKTRFDLERVTASYDLNVSQLESLLNSAPPDWFEITLHQHMPMFHMEHCVFCAFLSSGTDFRNCGRPCDTHAVALRDRVGAEHPLKADAGCRNTVFHTRAQTGAEFASRFLALGARHFRLEFLQETPDQMAAIVRQYQALFRGEISGSQLWRELKLVNQLGVTRGQLEGKTK